MKYTFIIPESFEKEVSKLDQNILLLFEKKLLLLQENPRHQSLRSHQVGKTPNGETIWSSSINMSYRFTWQYGPKKTEITLRHIGCHKIYRDP
jgi:mRNA-degrading endonuclease RelE of RelBE toxin-antitoxin system